MRRSVIHWVGAVLLAATVVVVGCVGDDPPATTPSDAGGPEAAPACTDACVENATRCDGPGVLETCRRQGACLAWGSGVSCATVGFCCGTECVPNDAKNCFACGQACTGATPACLPAPKKCGCTLSTCTPGNQGCDKVTGACVDCPVLTAATADFYVDRASFVGGTGTAACPFLTIKQALAAAALSTAPEKTIHLGPGIYDAASGESFPITLRGVSLIGEGAGKSIIRGAATGYARGVGQWPGSMSLTMLVGHPTAKTIVSGVTIEPPSALGDGVGVLCDTGTTTQVTTVGNPEGNTFFKNVTLGPGFDGEAAILVGPSVATGCNFKIEGSTISGGKRGIFAAGAGVLSQSDPAQEGYVALRVGDNTAAGANTFKNVRFPAAGMPTEGRAIELYDKMFSADIFRNTFEGNLYGVVSQSHSAKEPIIMINGNTFKNNIRYGVWALNQTAITQLNDNVFEGTNNTNLAVAAAQRDLGVGLYLEQPGTGGPAVPPAVLNARRNRFIGNEIGVLFTGLVNATVPSDFGNTASPGANVFSCNSSLHGGSVVGADVVVAYDNKSAALEFKFDGNEWDRTSLATSSNGADLLIGTAVNVTVSTTNVKLLATACAGGHVK
jgi:hypothetical protein